MSYVCFTKLWLTCAWPPVYTHLQSPTTWRRRKSQTIWTSGEDPQPASQPCCLKCVVSGLWSTCQKSWPILKAQRDQIKQAAQALINIWSITKPNKTCLWLHGELIQKTWKTRAGGETWSCKSARVLFKQLVHTKSRLLYRKWLKCTICSFNPCSLWFLYIKCCIFYFAARQQYDISKTKKKNGCLSLDI